MSSCFWPEDSKSIIFCHSQPLRFILCNQRQFLKRVEYTFSNFIKSKVNKPGLKKNAAFVVGLVIALKRKLKYKGKVTHQQHINLILKCMGESLRIRSKTEV